jgi:hypothetical protein
MKNLLEQLVILKINEFPENDDLLIKEVKQNVEWVLSFKELDSIPETALYRSIIDLDIPFWNIDYNYQLIAEPYSDTTQENNVIELYFQKMMSVFLFFNKEHNYSDGPQSLKALLRKSLKNDIDYVNKQLDLFMNNNEFEPTIKEIDNYLYNYRKIFDKNQNIHFINHLAKMHFVSYYYNFINSTL